LSTDRAVTANVLANTAKMVSESRLNNEALNTEKTKQALNLASAKAAAGKVGGVPLSTMKSGFNKALSFTDNSAKSFAASRPDVGVGIREFLKR